jgi:DNA primase
VFDRSVVDQVRQRTDLVELVGQYMPLRRAGLNWIARCPFHEERTPSFNVSGDRNFYFCFGCKASGDAFKFYEQIEGVNFVEALRALAEKAGVELPETRDPERIAEDRRQRDVGERLAAACESAAVYFEQCLVNAPYGELARDALSERGISEEVATRFRLGYAPARWDGLAEHLKAQRVSPADAELAGLLMAGRNGGWYDRFRHRLMFPVVDRANRVVAFSGRVLPVTEDMPEGLVPEDAGKYINSPETPLYKKSELLYGLGVARTAMRQKAEAILVEGNFDVVQMHQQGFTETVAPLGTSFTEAQAKLLRRFAESVTLVFDGDEAGSKAARASHSVCTRAGLVARVGVLPPKTDPDSYLRSTEEGKGPLGMQAVLRDAVTIVEWLIRDAGYRSGKDVPKQVAALRELAPVIAEVRDVTEQEMYVRTTARALFLDVEAARRAVRNYVAEVAAVSRRNAVDEMNFTKRVGLSAPDLDQEELSKKARRAGAYGLEALLVHPELSESPDAAELANLVEGELGRIIHEVRRQWSERGRLSAPELLELPSTDAAREWLSVRLMPPDEGQTADKEKWGKTLTEALGALRRVHASRIGDALARESARAGLQGDPTSEVHTLNEQLNMKRDLVRKRRDGT